MSENRSAIPYISNLVVTKRPTNKWVPTGYQREGQDILQKITDIPGIQCEITPYMGNVKAPALVFNFPSKKFFQDALAELNALENKDQNTLTAITNLQQTIARKDVIWVEDVLAAGNLGTLDNLWADVFSDALDMFPTWEEAEDYGIPLKIKEMQWNARIPYESNKTITLNVGVFSSENSEPTLYSLVFEDQVSKQQRLAYTQQIANNIEQVETQIENLEENDPQLPELQNRLDLLTKELQKRESDEIETIEALLSKQTVQASLPVLLASIISVLAEKHWPDLDLQLVLQRLQASLQNLK